MGGAIKRLLKAWLVVSSVLVLQHLQTGSVEWQSPPVPAHVMGWHAWGRGARLHRNLALSSRASCEPLGSKGSGCRSPYPSVQWKPTVPASRPFAHRGAIRCERLSLRRAASGTGPHEGGKASLSNSGADEISLAESQNLEKPDGFPSRKTSDASTRRAPDLSNTGQNGVAGEQEPMGWYGNWPPTNLRQLVNLYGGTRRFLLVNVPLLLLTIPANFLGIFSSLLSSEDLRPIVRKFRLDGTYPVFGSKRHYIDAPLNCTFTYPGDWGYDPQLELSRFRRQAQKQSYISRKAGGAPLPLVAVVPPGSSSTGVDGSIALYAQSAGTALTLAEALGSPEEAQGRIGGLALGYLPARKGKEAQATLVAAGSSPPPRDGGRESYRLELRARYLQTSNSGADPQEILGWSVWVTAQLARGSRESYLLILVGISPSDAPEASQRYVRLAAQSLEEIGEV